MNKCFYKTSFNIKLGVLIFSLIFTLSSCNKLHYKFFKDSRKTYDLSRYPIISRPIINQQIVYSVNIKGEITAFSLKEKKILWSYYLNLEPYQSSNTCINYFNDKIFVINGSKILVVLKDDGSELFRKTFPDIIRSKPVILNDQIVLINTVRGEVFAYDYVKHKIFWRLDSIIEEDIFTSNVYLYPLIYNNKLLVINSIGKIISLNSSNGEQLWLKNITSELCNNKLHFIDHQPFISDKNIFIIINNHLVKLDLFTGNIVEEKILDNINFVKLYKQYIFAINNQGELIILNLKNNEMKYIKSNLLNRITKDLFFDTFINEKNNNLFFNIINKERGEIYVFHVDTCSFIKCFKFDKNTSYLGSFNKEILFFKGKKIIIENY